MKSNRFGLTAALALAVSIMPNASHGYNVSFNSPIANTGYAPTATISYSGTYSWNQNEPSIDLIQVFFLVANDNPFLGTIVSSNFAQKTPTQPAPTTGGSGTFNSQNVTPALTAPDRVDDVFYITALPQNAVQGAYYPNGRNAAPYYKSVEVRTNAK